MIYPKIPQTISNPVNDNIQKLAALFPSAVKDGELDIDALKQELGEFTESGPEKYELTWAGKQQARQMAFEPIVGKTLTFVPEDSKQPDTTENLFIEGDNLEVLKLLRQNYYGAVKMICIDPPYNTGHDFIYNDNFKMSGDESDMAQGDMSDLGERYTKNRKDHNRYHANWLSMMYPRLQVAKDLLSKDGVVFINIDDNELVNLRKICDALFGEENFLAVISNTNNPKGRSDDKYIATAHEYIAMYCKDIMSYQSFGFEPGNEILRRYNKIDDNRLKYREIDLRKTGDNDLREDRPNLFYFFHFNKKTYDFYPSRDETPPNGYISIKPLRQDGKEGNWRWGLDNSFKNLTKLVPKFMPNRRVWGIMEKDFLKDRGLIKATSSWFFKDVNSERGSEEFISLGFDKRVFPNPKPLGTIKRMCKICMAGNCNELILDFFSGSAVTAHAVMQLNAEDGGNRKYIMVQLPEPCDENSEAFKAGYKNICEIGKKRIRRAGEKILEENKDKDGIENLDTGFKVFRVADTNINWLHQDLKGYDLFDHYHKNASDKDKLDFMPGFTDLDVVYEIMLRQTDIPLSSKVVPLSDIGQRTYMFADSFVVCLEQDITRDLVNRLAAIEPLPVKFVFRDSAFDDNIALKDETFRRLNALIEKNSGGEKPAYTVEFI